MNEPAVTLTDYALALEAAILAALVAAEPAGRPDLRLWFVAFFAASAVAAALGGTAHGFRPAHATPLGTALWRGALLAVGVTALSGGMIGAGLLSGGPPPTWALVVGAMAFAVYALVVLVVSDAFGVAVASYLPTTVFLFAAYWTMYRSSPREGVAVGLAGLGLTLVAAVVQRLRIGVHPVHFDHNALYHVMQGVALAMIFWSARDLIRG